jgi:hypothetical protein
MEEKQEVYIDEVVVLSKFNGAPLPANEFERIHIKNGTVVAKETIKNGKVIATETLLGGSLETLPDQDKGVE